MRQANKLLAITWMSLCVAAGTGCEDPNQRISVLENDNVDLRQKLEALRGESDLVKQERDRCYDDLASAQRHAQDLQGQLAFRSTPAPQPAPKIVELPGQWQQVPGGAMVAVPGSVLFAPGKITLRSSSKSVLDKIASEINGSFSDKDIFVFGHTDTDPIKKSGWKDNRQLSSERALAVVRELQSQGVSAKRLVACACGEHRPVASNSSQEGKARNRRVEIFAVDPTIVAAN